jgi:hypothetical protein
MSAASEKRRVRRITVALRGEAAEAQLLGWAARFARETASELAGVFLEDIDLLHLAELPLAIEICRSTSARRPVEATELARQLASQASAAEQVLARVAEEAGVAWSFSVARGAVTTLLVKAVAEADVTLVPAARRVLWAYEDAAAQARRWREERAPVTVVFDRSAAAKRALEVGRRLAEAEKRPLSVILTAASSEAGERLRQRADQVLQGRPARFHTLIRPEAAQLLETVRDQRTGMLVVPASETALMTDTVHALQGRLDCAALVVR